MITPFTPTKTALCVLLLLVPGAALAESSPLDTFALSSLFVEPEGQCLDANPGGSSIQTPCDYNEAQYWRALAAADGSHFQLTTEATPGLCLTALPGTVGAPGAGGGARMAACADDPAQQWLFTDSSVEYHYRLQNFAGGIDFCLEGNRVATGSFLDGAAFLDSCNDVSGQLWRVGGAVPVNGIPVPLDQLDE